MSTLQIRGHVIEFPYHSPYAPQRVFMDRVLAALTKSENALLEAPTGSGKTLALLCSVLAWNKAQQKPSKIYFTSRTHSQLQQILKELRTTSYQPKTLVLGSRKHYCIHNKVSKAADVSEECKKTVEEHMCFYYNHVDQLVTEAVTKQQKIWDIEDLTALGKKVRGCPYYAAREITKNAELIVAPYNYLLEPTIREAMRIDLNGAILIIDEGHNVEDICRNAAGRQFTQEQLEYCVDEFRRLHKKHQDDTKDVTQFISSIMLWVKSEKRRKTIVHRGKQVENFWKELGVFDKESLMKIRLHISNAVELSDSIDGEEERKVLSPALIQILESLDLVLKFMFQNANSFAAYRLVLLGSDQAEIPTLGFLCMSPSVAFEEVSNSCKSVIITSGTLSPMDSFGSELGVSFPETFAAPHVVDASRVFAVTVGVGKSGRKLLSTYTNVDDLLYQDEMGETVKALYETVDSGGILVFFPSYKLLFNLCKRWEQTKLWKHLEREEYFVENRRLSEFEESLSSYKQRLSSGYKKALFFAVCRGKISEGVDFPDQYARLVVTIGIPFPSLHSLEIKLKKQYNDMRSSLPGSRWYTLQAYRALNQALGRCIRHKNDFGAIVMIDSRLKERHHLENISKWVRKYIQSGTGHIENVTEFHQLLQEMKNFYRRFGTEFRATQGTLGISTNVPEASQKKTLQDYFGSNASHPTQEEMSSKNRQHIEISFENESPQDETVSNVVSENENVTSSSAQAIRNVELVDEKDAVEYNVAGSEPASPVLEPSSDHYDNVQDLLDDHFASFMSAMEREKVEKKYGIEVSESLDSQLANMSFESDKDEESVDPMELEVDDCEISTIVSQSEIIDLSKETSTKRVITGKHNSVSSEFRRNNLGAKAKAEADRQDGSQKSRMKLTPRAKPLSSSNTQYVGLKRNITPVLDSSKDSTTINLQKQTLNRFSQPPENSVLQEDQKGIGFERGISCTCGQLLVKEELFATNPINRRQKNLRMYQRGLCEVIVFKKFEISNLDSAECYWSDIDRRSYLSLRCTRCNVVKGYRCATFDPSIIESADLIYMLNDDKEIVKKLDFCEGSNDSRSHPNRRKRIKIHF